MFDLRIGFSAFTIALAGLAHPALAQDRALAFSLTGGAGIAPSYFGADDYRVSPAGRLGFTGLRFGSVQLGDPDGPARFVEGTRIRGAFRYIPKRKGSDELAGLDDVDAALELGLGVHHSAEWWEIYGDLRYGVIGHKAVAGEIGANLIYRGAEGLTVFAGPRADFGNARFARTYFGVTDSEVAALPPGSNLEAYRPSGGFHSVGLEIGGYYPLSADWGVSGTVRYDRLRGDAAASPIVKQGSRNQISAEIGLTRHFNLRF
ncbi:MipA/OmpV family protein [Roseinatronobacter bogoriensis]|uniref:MipA/OmpV family protein n=1 Tax=Roseinatronobacter bogoriensis subsp. barguzinensis TaxID=441209 RepID=A0A2K8KC27_9RHOB|nr:MULTISPECIES: MipA/OmpV family protein [Rhodobaca]ATX66536.1 MipA/OmpV family protein [Rhodobaca barguzinensis]MBB4207700.1 outer membrane scaffolding protein for murein synthesis (MipA/OmpV family) [Rhodobaca bogoriensis DSM 18756]TDW39993.1 outer membrane scaffolding protein for murein synthesis (MipA/OmpV family) [Rhodobaca barguzinensis]TDY70854.1 outer membrane scaffolding protein for murein synthesis (MipA/OmpV family) [Rhodobaca bogoriensis DSM 18756]